MVDKNTLTLNEFFNNCDAWAKRSRLDKESDASSQMGKGAEEFGKLLRHVCYTKDIHQIKDAIGDIAVCLSNASIFKSKVYRALMAEAFEYNTKKNHLAILREMSDIFLDGVVSTSALYKLCVLLKQLCNQFDINHQECFYIAWHDIKDRKLIIRDKVAVKWENMTDAEKIEYEQAH